jgi:hypothetical protein
MGCDFTQTGQAITCMRFFSAQQQQLQLQHVHGARARSRALQQQRTSKQVCNDRKDKEEAKQKKQQLQERHSKLFGSAAAAFGGLEL